MTGSFADDWPYGIFIFKANGKCSDPYARVQRPGRPLVTSSHLRSDFHGVWRSLSPTFPATPAAMRNLAVFITVCAFITFMAYLSKH